VPGSEDRSPRLFGIFPHRKIAGNGNGNGHEERAHVPADAVTEPTDQATDETAPEVKKSRDWTVVGMWAVIIVMNAMALALASSGQIDGTWKWAGLSGDDPRKWLLPGVTEIGYLGFLMLGQYALRRKQSPFLWWGFAAAVAAAAIFMNSIHGAPGFVFRQGLIFGVASGVSLAMTFAKFLIDYRSRRQEDGHTVGLRPRAWTFQAIWSFPRLAFRADLIIARCERVDTRERAYELAELWRWVYADAKEEKDSNRKIARRTAWMTVYRELGMRVIEPKNLKLGKVTFAPPPPPPPPPPAAPAPAAPVATPAPTATAVRPTPNAAPNASSPAPSSAPAPKITIAKPVPDEWFTDHREHITAVQTGMTDWATREKAPTVNEVQAFVPNRTNAANTAACIRVLRARAAAGSN
jgi:hypothetical protein